MNLTHKRSSVASSSNPWYALASLFLWFAVFVALIGFSAFFFRIEGSGTGGAGLVYGFILMGLLAAAGIGVVLGTLFALIALGRAEQPGKLWPLALPFVLVIVYAFSIGMLFTADSHDLFDETLFVIIHALGYISVAVLAGVWLSRANSLLAVVVSFLFVLFFVRYDVLQLWSLDQMSKLESRGHTTQVTDYRMELPSWLRALTKVDYRTYQVQVEIERSEYAVNPHVSVILGPRLFGKSANVSRHVEVSVADGRVAEITVPNYVRVSGPGIVYGHRPGQERGRSSARLMESDKIQYVRWLRTDQLNRLRCTFHESKAGACELLSQPAEGGDHDEE